MTTDRFGTTARLLKRGAGPLLVAALAAGCSSTDSTAEPSPPTEGSIATPAATLAATTSVSTTPDGESTQATSVDLPDPSALLAGAVEAAAAGYHFATTVTVGSDVALTAEGDRIGDSTRMTVASNGAAVDWVITPEGSWVAENGVWQEIERPAAAPDPLAALAAPTSITVDAANADGSTLRASYPAAAFALPGDAPIDVVIDIAGANLSSLSYFAPGTDPPTAVRTVISALTDTAPVTAPGS